MFQNDKDVSGGLWGRNPQRNLPGDRLSSVDQMKFPRSDPRQDPFWSLVPQAGEAVERFVRHVQGLAVKAYVSAGADA